MWVCQLGKSFTVLLELVRMQTYICAHWKHPDCMEISNCQQLTEPTWLLNSQSNPSLSFKYWVSDKGFPNEPNELCCFRMCFLRWAAAESDKSHWLPELAAHLTFDMSMHPILLSFSQRQLGQLYLAWPQWPDCWQLNWANASTELIFVRMLG